jgi:hypothetical protein
MHDRFARPVGLAMLFVLVIANGCRHGGLSRRVVYGKVACGGEKVATGTVRFVPVENTPGPATVALIVDGQYRALNRGGVPIGKHRVEVAARRPTGRKIKSPEGQMVDETVAVGPELYAGSQSPLLVEVRADGDGRIDFAIPK